MDTQYELQQELNSIGLETNNSDILGQMGYEGDFGLSYEFNNLDQNTEINPDNLNQNSGIKQESLTLEHQSNNV